MSETIETEALARAAAADAALALEIVGRFFAQQIDAGAVLRGEIAAHVRSCAEAVALREPHLAVRVDAQATLLIASLPAGWAEGDDPGWMPA